MKNFTTERDGQISFFDNYHIDWRQNNSILVENTDGVYNGCLLEFKLSINDLNVVLFQAIKYLSKLRIKGLSVPATILLVDLNNEICYKYKSYNYIDDIQKVYRGSASVKNHGFLGNNDYEKIIYGEQIGSRDLKNILKAKKNIEEEYLPIDIDENCIVGWATRYYQENKNANKGDFLGDETGQITIKGEIREPNKFKGLINPYTGKTNEKFKYLMDCLNDRLHKKDLGAFYTPKQYADLAAEMVINAVNRILLERERERERERENASTLFSTAVLALVI